MFFTKYSNIQHIPLWPVGLQKNVCWFILLLVACFTMVPASREKGVYLAYKCTKPERASRNKLPVIMLHGLTLVKEYFDSIYKDIPLKTGRRVCAYDARNHGYSGWNDSFTLDVLVEDLGKFMKDRGIRKASLVGHSMGGSTIMKFALENPSKVESIFVEDSSPVNNRDAIAEGNALVIEFLKMVMDSLSAIPAGADEETAKKAVIDYITQVTGEPPYSRLFIIFPLHFKDGAWQWKPNLQLFIRAVENWSDGFLGEDMKGRYDGRSFFIYGKDSPIKVNEDKEEILKLFPNTEFFGVEGASHLVLETNSTLYLNKLVKFLNDV